VDFVRNFLARHGLHHALDVFQEDWYDLVRRGGVPADADTVPDALAENKQLRSKLDEMAAETTRAAVAARAAAAEQAKAAKERDFHRLGHRRLVKETAVLQREVDRLQTLVADQAKKVRVVTYIFN
jgi:hypothetical protein